MADFVIQSFYTKEANDFNDNSNVYVANVNIHEEINMINLALRIQESSMQLLNSASIQNMINYTLEHGQCAYINRDKGVMVVLLCNIFKV